MADTENILLSLRYCWMLDRTHIQRLHFPFEKTDVVQDWITGAAGQGLIEELRWSKVREVPGEKKRTIRQPSMWLLTAAGEASIRHSPAYPGGKRRTRPRAVLEHDKRAVDMIVDLITLARDGGLSGIRVWREVKLHPTTPRPRMDALVVFECGGSWADEHPDLVPWSLSRPLDDEMLWRVALEADNDTESMQVIAGKAQAYKEAMASRDWHAYWQREYGGGTPLILWCAPNEPRASAIARQWEQHWPAGHWGVTADAQMAQNQWLYRWQGATKQTSLHYYDLAEKERRRVAEARRVEEEKKRKLEAERKVKEGRPLAELLGLHPDPLELNGTFFKGRAQRLISAAPLMLEARDADPVLNDAEQRRLAAWVATRPTVSRLQAQIDLAQFEVQPAAAPYQEPPAATPAPERAVALDGAGMALTAEECQAAGWILENGRWLHPDDVAHDRAIAAYNRAHATPTPPPPPLIDYAELGRLAVQKRQRQSRQLMMVLALILMIVLARLALG